MTIQLPLLFHFNQHISQFATAASLTCYRGLLHLLRNHSRLKFNIHISGTLIHALEWLDPEPLALIRAGLADGQFELLGSTYAQNVPYATDDWDNARQIKQHRQVLHDTFGVAPISFWNPERCWRQSLLPIIAAAGYSHTLIEDHILEAAGHTSPSVLTTGQGDQTLTIIRDDETLKHKFNFAAWFNRPAQLLEHLDQLAAHHPQACLAYAEDAEAMGLWGWGRGLVPGQTWHFLDRLLDQLARRPDLELIHLSTAPSPTAVITPIGDGSAAWMDASLLRTDAPYHEDGYANWFDFNRRSPRLIHYRKLYDRIRRELQETAALPLNRAAKRLYQSAEHIFLAHQYEFGCIGIGGNGHLGQPGFRGWDGVRGALVLAYAARQAQNPRSFHQQADINDDGLDEFILCDGRQLIITTPAGGRLLYWFDLTAGRQWLGNPLAIIPAAFEGDAYLPQLPDYPLPWLPDSDQPAAAPAGATRVVEEAPTRLGRFLPDWIWSGEEGPFGLLTYDQLPVDEITPLTAQRRGLVDRLTLAEEVLLDGTQLLDGRLAENQVTFSWQIKEDLQLKKRYHLKKDSIQVDYLVSNTGSQAHSLTLAIANELSPDYDIVLRLGRSFLDFTTVGGCPAVINRDSNRAITLSPSQPWITAVEREAFLALETELTFQLACPAGKLSPLTILLSADASL